MKKKDLELITDPEEIRKFEETTNLPIGLINNQPFYNFRMDLFRNTKTGKLFRYCSVEYPASGGAAILVVIRQEDGKKFFLLNKQYRVFLDKTVYEIPRGFMDPADKDELKTAIRELFEETGIRVGQKDMHITKLGAVHPDSGLSNNLVGLYLAEISADIIGMLTAIDSEEPIHGHRIVSEKAFRAMLADNTIKDAYTFSAYVLYQGREKSLLRSEQDQTAQR